MSNLPFNEGTKIYQVFQTLMDCTWHCGKHELPGTQPAKAIQIIRQHGYEIENRTTFCDVCVDRTVHRRLVSTSATNTSIVRSNIPESLKKRIKAVYQNREAITQRECQPAEVEVDHRFPQVRWSKPEDDYPLTLSPEEIKAKFQLLTRQNNLWKSRYCERCVQTGQRGTFIGINYFYEGGPFWPADIPTDDEQGCQGCFWYNPDKWRQSLNEFIEQRKRDE